MMQFITFCLDEMFKNFVAHIHKRIKVSLYSALFTVRCVALTRVPLTFELGYDQLQQITVYNAEYISRA